MTWLIFCGPEISGPHFSLCKIFQVDSQALGLGVWRLYALHHILPFKKDAESNGLRQANLVRIAYASSEGSGEPAHLRSLARTSAARSYKQ